MTLARSALNRPEMAFIAWSGLKGAVPILLAAFAVLGHVPDHQRIYDVIFVVVLVSVVIQGGLVPVVAARLGIPMQVQPELPWELSVKLAEPPRDRVEHAVEAGSRADGGRLDDLPLGNRAWVTLVVRDAHAVPPRPDLDCTPAISYSCWASTMNPSLPTCSRKAGDRTLFSDETLEQALRQLRMHRSRQVVD